MRVVRGAGWLTVVAGGAVGAVGAVVVGAVAGGVGHGCRKGIEKVSVLIEGDRGRFENGDPYRG